MQNFDELCRAYQGWTLRNRDYNLQAAAFVTRFARELGTEIGAPPAFALQGQQPTQLLYIRPLLFDPENESFDALSPVDTLSWDADDGAWYGGLGIHLEPAKGAFPKTEFQIALRFKLEDGEIDLQVFPETNFRMRIDDPATWRPTMEHIVAELLKFLNLQPWDAYGKK